MISSLLLLLAACGLGPCEDLCEAQAACIQDEVDAEQTSWEQWTGYDGRGDYVDACLDTWEASLEESRRGDVSNPRKKLRRLCRTELDHACP